MIEVYEGAPGSGKSYHALLRGLELIHRRRHHIVAANFPIVCKTDKEKARWHYQDEWTVEQLVGLSESQGLLGHEGAGLLIVDEAGVVFNSRDWQIAGDRRKAWIKFMSQSRKLGWDIILITQDVRMLDRQIRACAEWYVKHVKLRSYLWWLPLQVFATVAHWQGGSFKGRVGLVLFSKRVAGRYDSMRLFEGLGELTAALTGRGVPAAGGSLPAAPEASGRASESPKAAEAAGSH